MKTKLIVRSLCLATVLLGSSLSSAWAANVIKLDTPTMSNGAADWSAAPAATDIGEFDSTVSVANLAAMALGGNVTLGGLQFDGTMQGPLAIASGNTLTLGASGINMSAASQSVTFNNLLALGAGQTWLVANNQTLNVKGVVSGAGFPLTINDGSTANSGSVIFNTQANTYTGGTLINGGVVQVGIASSLGTGAITNNGGILRLPPATALTISVPLYFTGTSMLDLNNITGSPSLNGPWSGNGTVIITNLDVPTSTLTMGGSAAASTMNNFTGKIIVAQNNSGGLISQGTLRFNSGTTAYNFGNASASFNLGTNGNVVTLTSRDGGTINIGELIGGPQTVLLGSRSTAGTTIWSVGGLNTSTTFAGSISNYATPNISALTKVGTGTLILTGTNTDGNASTTTNGPTGPIVISAGTLQIGDGNADGTLTSGTTTIAGGATLAFDRPDNYTITNSIANSGAITIMGGGTNLYATAGTYTGAGGINVINGGFVMASPAASLGAIYVGAGMTFDASPDASLTSVAGLSGSGTVNLTGGSLTAVTVTGNVSPGGTGTAGTLTINGGLVETGNVNNQFELSTVGGTNDLLVVNGNLNLSGLNTISLSDFGGGVVPPGVYPLISYTGTLTGGAANFSIFAIGFNASVTNITSVTPNQIAVVVTTAARPPLSLTWVGNSTTNVWDLISTNWANGGTNYVFLDGDSATFTDTGSVNPPLNVQGNVFAASLLVNNKNRNYIITGSGSIAGPYGLTKTNSGNLTLLATNSYTGPTVIGGGVLELETGALLTSGAAGPIGAASSNPTNLVFYGSTLRYSGSDTNMTDHGVTIVGGVTVDVTNPAAVFTASGVVAGSGGATNALTKVGQGVLVLQNANSYAGGTVISNGMLAMGNNNANWNLSTAGGLGSVTNAVTFMGTNGILQLYGFPLYQNDATASYTYNDFTNPLVVPAGQAGTLQLPARGSTATGAGAGLDSSLTGGGTLNLVVNYVRYPLSGNWSGFTGQINVTGAGFPNVNNNTVGAVTADIDEFRINNTYGYSNAVIYLYGSTAPGNQNTPQSTLVMCQTVASGATIDIGELGSDPSTPTPIMGTGTGSAGNTTWRVGWKNTTNTFYGVIANDSQTGVGVSSITKVGTGKWILAGANTYSGSTTVSNGVLALITNPNTYNDASIANSANILINTNAMLDLSALSSPTLTLNAGQTLGGGGTLKGGVAANTGANINPGSAVATGALTITGGLTESGGVNNNFQLTNISPNVINVQGDLNVSSGTQNINLSGFGTNAIAAGTYPLFTYTGNLYGALNNFFVSFGAYAYTGTLTNITTTTPPQIAVIVVAPARSVTNVVWKGDGVANNWDTVGNDWLLGGVGTAKAFESGDSVMFNDVGAGNTNVTLQSTLYPASLVLSNSTLVNYTLTGNGNITGTIGLLKTNSGTVTILATNTYTGVTVIGSGTISVAYLPNGGLASPIGAASNNTNNLLFTGGTLAYSGPSASTDRGMTLKGSGGTFTVTNGTTLTLAGTITGSGGFTLNGGKLTVGTGGSTMTNYTGPTVVNNGELDMNFANNPQSGIYLSSGLTINNGGVVGAMGSSALEGYTGVTPYLSVTINAGGKLTVPNTVSGFAGHLYGVLYLNGGTLAMEEIPPYSGNTVTYGGWALNNSVVVNGGTNTSYISDPVCSPEETGGTVFNVAKGGTANGIDLDVTGAFVITPGSPDTGIIKTGNGTMRLDGTNTYTQFTTISNGTLLVNGSIINITNNGPVSVKGGTLGGFGLIAGAVTVQSGGTLAPGAGTNVAGTVLTLNSNLTVQTGGTVQMQVSHSANDSITCSGTITYGGMLMITTNAGDATPYQVGDTFYLFNLGVASGTYGAGSSFVTIQPPPGPGLGWSGSSLTTDGSIQVVTASPVVAGFTAGPTTGSGAAGE